ncbi:1-deoxy-D-xylulose-5-phosphate synthase [Agathobacter rectalis]|uniref:1-deoxy-D-xylulose-5-phosphate synthase n=1 Tax=Agathobacter rectalis TaxID=39491 RepID=A0A0M6WLH7_9FIRM|nr:1-deoxy-D-xylulose-5-phosphate synthase [Agathobacter rectalis]CRL37950.1 1-deoxy-D-xylulose-5-phosphate synthase [Agathobacter rectalis]
MVLEKIQKENDIKKLTPEELELLKDEIRQFLIESISVTGGHLASNLGVVELTMALHLCFDLPKDKIVWDVGHQSYTHKILTGRKDGFSSLRQYGGMSGFPKTDESDCDCFNTGHSSTSISAGLGLATARQVTGEDYHVVSVIGDGALTGGMAYEALNNASSVKGNFIIVLNDNHMSISENVGGISQYLSGFRTADAYRDFKNNVMNSLNHIPIYGERMVKHIRNTKSSIKQLFIPGMFFEEMGIIYLGPVDGSDIKEMCRVFDEAKRVDGPVLVHVLTKKGAGYGPAERYPSRFHGAEPFVIETGLPKNKRTKANYTDVFSTVMKKLGERNPKVVAITAAMAEGTGLRRFHRNFPDRFFDVGIAEAHATTFAAGLAKAGLIPVFAVYSSFLQRAFDQILHDVCIQNLHVIFAIDRAGLVGSDGETHQGIFDISYLSVIPNMTIMAPKNKWELSDMMKFAVAYDGPIALRYPRGAAYDGLKEIRQPIELAKSELIRKGSTVAIMALGSMVKTAVDVVKLLEAEGISATLINARFAMPFDKEAIKELPAEHSLLVTMEENVQSGGFGEHVTEYVKTNGIALEVLTVALPDCYVEHGNVEVLKKELHVDAESVAKRIIAVL